MGDPKRRIVDRGAASPAWSGDGQGPAVSPGVEFLCRHVKDNKALSAEAAALIGTLVINSDRLPWKSNHAVEYVFENSKGEVEVCFADRHLFFSNPRQNFIAKHIERDSCGFSPEEQEILREWVRASETGPWEKKRESTITLNLLPGTSGGEPVLECSEKWLKDQEGDLVEESFVERRGLRFGMGLISAESMVERALAEGEKKVRLLFPHTQLEDSEIEWLTRLGRRFPQAEIKYRGGSLNPGEQEFAGYKDFKMPGCGLRMLAVDPPHN